MQFFLRSNIQPKAHSFSIGQVTARINAGKSVNVSGSFSHSLSLYLTKYVLTETNQVATVSERQRKISNLKHMYSLRTGVAWADRRQG